MRRELLHSRAGEALVELYHPRDDAHAAELARHFLAAGARGDAERAVRYSVIAAQQALARLAYEEAAGLFSHALERAGGDGGSRDESKQRRRYDLLLALGEARWCAGDLDSARDAYLQAADVADTRSATRSASAARRSATPDRCASSPRRGASSRSSSS